MKTTLNLEKITRKRQGNKINNLWELSILLKDFVPCDDFSRDPYDEYKLPICTLINKMFDLPIAYCKQEYLPPLCYAQYSIVYNEKYFFTLYDILVNSYCVEIEPHDLTNELKILTKKELLEHQNNDCFRTYYNEIIEKLSTEINLFGSEKYDKDGYDIFGFDKNGFDVHGNDKYGYDINGKFVFDDEDDNDYMYRYDSKTGIEERESLNYSMIERGKFIDGKLEGYGEREQYGEVERGEFHEGELNGYGTKGTFGDVYEQGEYIDGFLAKGKTSYNGNTKEGYFSRLGSLHGPGKETFKEGFSIEGVFDYGKPVGKCLITFPDGSTFQGEAINGYIVLYGDCLNGYGARIDNTCTIETGNFSNGNLNGVGKVNWRNGSYFEGIFDNGLAHGYGKMIWDSGKIEEGTFIHSDIYKPKQVLDYSVTLFSESFFSGHGKRTFPNGIVENGEFVNGEFIKGKTFFSDGQIIEK